ncbi:nuclear transport factor 2 family protein [Bradyrhizobium sp. 139]|uniref:nuclear transport factor 2 family protein n=1 Tax=Bradyrhizobium sp. 139 TaxID=2782616 RepID=UPI001FF8CD01|nr:nuclear transport factor 2 family protein [Bradyrhizobium sp. 139]MCK1744474.1 nuclear transport factor 2 family protein [Bradyrhizobium sp. 139]
MSFDPMAAAVDWLDAYRAGEIETILGMYADDAIVHCGCGGMKTITGRGGLRAYWVDRLRQYPASELDNLQPSHDGTMISYITSIGVVSAVLAFNTVGKIKTLSCGPSS